MQIRHSFDIPSMAADYFDPGPQVEFIKFAYRLGALVWTYRAMQETIRQGIEDLAALRTSGSQSGYVIEHGEDRFEFEGPGEFDLVLGESMGVLEQDAVPICGGIIIVSAAAAIESLVTDVLDESEVSALPRAGLTPKIRWLMQRWSGDLDDDGLIDS